MTFMFMDICGFTFDLRGTYKNRDDPPEGLVELINKFLDVQTKIIINNRGTIDKYMGDCIMVFGMRLIVKIMLIWQSNQH